MLLLTILYIASALGLAMYGFNSFVLLGLYFIHRNRKTPAPPPPSDWPSVTVQLPIYNEQHVIKRLINAAVALQYPADRLTIQVLDDSTDATSHIAQKCIAGHQERGIAIQHVQRATRTGYKAGALAHGMSLADSELIAIFDADFIPSPDFLQKTVPYFADENTGMVQARWSHINADYDTLTRAQAIALDSHFIIEQTARQRSGLFMNFSGTAGIWRKSCIEDSGGWQMDTLSEDIDLSYRAQMRGWKLQYLPDVVAPAEIPLQVAAFKRQQSRWATGTVQVLLKLWRPILTTPLTIWQRIEAVLHLSGYLIHPLLMILLLSSVPLMLSGNLSNLPLTPLGIAAMGPPLMAVVTQIRLYRNWLQRLTFFPFLLLIGAGITVSNSLAVWRAIVSRKPQVFQRTPKFHLHTDSGIRQWAVSAYALPFERIILLELGLSLYAFTAAGLALSRSPGLVPFMLLYALGFGYVGGLGVWQAWRVRVGRRKALSQLGLSTD